MKNNNNGMWSFYKIWNECLLDRTERPVEPRDRLWASELGKSPADLYLKLKGEKPTNPPNARSLRKFEAGNIWEWLIKLILKRAGIFQSEQRYSVHEYEGMLPVTGYMDVLAGGKPDYEKAKKELEGLELPQLFLRAGEKIVEHLTKEYPDGLTPKAIEIKSSSSFMFDVYEKKSIASANHKMQLFHYLKAENLPEGVILYICKDDCRMLEIPVKNPSAVEDEYKKEIETISNYYIKNEMPPLEKPIIWDNDMEKFAKNWKIAYSNYLTKLYKFKDQMEFDNKYSPIVERWNRVVVRLREGKEITQNNQQAMDEMNNGGFDILKILENING